MKWIRKETGSQRDSVSFCAIKKAASIDRPINKCGYKVSIALLFSNEYNGEYQHYGGEYERASDP